MVGPRASLGGCGKSLPHRDSIPGPYSPQRVAIPTALSRPPNSDPIPKEIYINRVRVVGRDVKQGVLNPGLRKTLKSHTNVDRNEAREFQLKSLHTRFSCHDSSNIYLHEQHPVPLISDINDIRIKTSLAQVTAKWENRDVAPLIINISTILRC
jgi:hypothetical protein